MKKVRDFLHNLFIPSERNNFRAKALHYDFLTYYLIIAVSLAFLFKNTTPYLTKILGFATDITTEKLYQLTNKEREKNNLLPLVYSEKLAQAANRKANDMFEKNYWAHYAPDGKTPWDFILSTGYQYEYAGENLAKNFLFSQAVVETWMNSRTHRENILRGEYIEVGFAIVNGVLNGEETTLVVQMFGKPTTKTLGQVDKQIVTTSTPSTKKVSTKIGPSAILAKQASQPNINLFSFSIDFVYVFIFFLLLVLTIDFYVASKMNIVRINGKNLGHFIFLIFIFFGLMLFFTKGTIL